MYPYDWGFVPSTRAEDGDPLDAMRALRRSDVARRVVIPSIPIGIRVVTQKESDKRSAFPTIASLRCLAGTSAYKHVDDLLPRVRAELEKFFMATSRMEGKEVPT